MRKKIIAVLVALLAPGLAAAAGAKTYAFDGDFEDAAFALETAIVNRGLVVDHVSRVGEMLARTKADVGGKKDLFVAADVYQFCSARLSRKVMEADWTNIAHCPYGVFVADTGDGVVIGYREMPEGAMQEVEALLDSIAREAVAF